MGAGWSRRHLRAACILGGVVCLGCGNDSSCPLPSVNLAVEPQGTTELVLYLNGDGGSIWPGPADPAANQTPLVGIEKILPPFDGVPFAPETRGVLPLSVLRESLERIFAPIAVRVTLDRPTVANYSMLMIGGHPQDLGVAEPTVSGIAEVTCTPDPRGTIGFVFAEAIDSMPALVANAAHEVGHMLGLRHSSQPLSLMDSQANGSQLTFLPGEESGPLQCSATGWEDPMLDLARLLGPRDVTSGSEPALPQAWIAWPVNHLAVPPIFPLAVTVPSAGRGWPITLLIDGRVAAIASGLPYQFWVSAPWSLTGEHEMRLVARGPGGEEVSLDAVSVTIDPTLPRVDPPEGVLASMSSPAGSPAYPFQAAWLGETTLASWPGLGVPCSKGDDCTTGVCVSVGGGEGRCSRFCHPTDAHCDEGADCMAADVGSVCVAAAGCSSAAP